MGRYRSSAKEEVRGPFSPGKPTYNGWASKQNEQSSQSSEDAPALHPSTLLPRLDIDGEGDEVERQGRSPVQSPEAGVVGDSAEESGKKPPLANNTIVSQQATLHRV